MKGKRILLSGALAVILGASSASASLWPGLATKASEQSGAFHTDNYVEQSGTYYTPYLIDHSSNSLYAGRVNAAIYDHKEAFAKELTEDSEKIPTEGWMYWYEGLVGNYISNNEGITSIVLIEQKLGRGAAHGSTFVKGLNFKNDGNLFTLQEILPNLTVRDVNACIELTAKRKHFSLLPNHTVTSLPTNFYVGKNHVVYAIYQVGELAPSSTGVVSIPIGRTDRR